MTPRVLVIQHEEQCPPAWFGTWLSAYAEIDVRRPYAGDALPEDLSDHAALLVLGGHMGANDDAQFGWLEPTKQLIRRAATTGTPTLGICLGHQLAAVALGGSIEVNPRGQQLGGLDLGWLGGASEDALLGTLPARGIQWNNDVVSKLPAGAQVLAQTQAGEIQAIRYADTVWGVQVHPEADLSVVTPWADADREHQDTARIDAALAEIGATEQDLRASWQPVARALGSSLGTSLGATLA